MHYWIDRLNMTKILKFLVSFLLVFSLLGTEIPSAYADEVNPADAAADTGIVQNNPPVENNEPAPDTGIPAPDDGTEVQDDTAKPEDEAVGEEEKPADDPETSDIPAPLPEEALSPLSALDEAAPLADEEYFQDENDEGIQLLYKITGNDTVQVGSGAQGGQYKTTNYSYGGTITIPETVVNKGISYKVTSIAPHAFGVYSEAPPRIVDAKRIYLSPFKNKPSLDDSEHRCLRL